MAAQENGSEQRLKYGKAAFSHPTSSAFFLKKIMSDALKEQDEMVRICGKTITNLGFADDSDILAEEEQELEALTESLDKTSTRYKMEIRVEKNRLITISANGIPKDLKVKTEAGKGFKLQGPWSNCL